MNQLRSICHPNGIRDRSGILRVLTGIVITTLVLVACSSDDAAGRGSGEIGNLGEIEDLDGQWWALEAGTINGQSFPKVGGRWTMHISDTGIGGIAACNRYGVSCSLEDGKMIVGEVSYTQAGCLYLAAEQVFLTALQQSQSLKFKKTGDFLIVSASSGVLELRFRMVASMDMSEIVEKTWKLDAISGQKASIKSDAEAFLELKPGGAYTVSAGCRKVSGSYHMYGDELRIFGMLTDGGCPMEFEKHEYFVILTASLHGARVRFEDGKLSLLSTDGNWLRFGSAR